jgi:hypothetical protein
MDVSNYIFKEKGKRIKIAKWGAPKKYLTIR